MKRNVKTISMIVLACSMGIAVQAQLIDDFGGGLSAYTLTPVLYSGSGVPATTTISFTDTTGGLEADAANYNDIEQALFLRSDYSLAVGQTLRVDVNWSLGNNQDLGLCVASTATPPAASTNPLGNSRTSLSYAFVGIRGSSWHVVSSGFDGATGLTTQQYQPGSGTTTGLFITRTSGTVFQLGYDANGGADTVLTTYTFANSANVGTAIGFYADMRAAGSIGTFDNLQIAVPEPTTMALCGLGGLFGLVARKRRGMA
jgi:hypothetical protein